MTDKITIERAYAEGWRAAANWTDRDDLLADIDSAAYADERNMRLAMAQKAVPADAQQRQDKTLVHLKHCNFGEYSGTCKYGDDDKCPALSDSFSWIGKAMDRGMAQQAEPAAKVCGAPAVGGPCVLPRGHNMGRADVPMNHQPAPPAPAAVPPGYVLVPVEPTQAMVKAGRHALSEWLCDAAPLREHMYEDPFKSAYRDAMIAAAGGNQMNDVSCHHQCTWPDCTAPKGGDLPPLRAAFEAWCNAAPEFAPEFAPHRAWAEQFAWFAWQDAVAKEREQWQARCLVQPEKERQAQEAGGQCDNYVTGYIDGCNDCAAAIRKGE